MFIDDSKVITSIKIFIDNKQVKNNKIQENNFTPWYPKLLPNKPQNIKLNKGNNIIKIYINVDKQIKN